MMKPVVELLAPASSLESVVGTVQAGADAVYIGGSMFGARAYANNPNKEQLREMIDYVHLHGRKIFLTVNTLLKNNELIGSLIAFLEAYYEAGIDAVIVQDIGVLSLVRKVFPNLPIHASTQMNITGALGAGFLETLGVSRIVTAREISLEEIRKIKENTSLEIESFIHGALCYSYSGQCLLSSFLGGRSGNRGRCAQPCRLPYQFSTNENQSLSSKKNASYLLSPKDICTVDILPDIIQAGVYSLKIEGRMKRPEYAAGVTAVYRKYLDRYLQYGSEEYRIEEADRKLLMDIFNRGSFHSGYYQSHNGKHMMSEQRPGRKKGKEGDILPKDKELLFQDIADKYINTINKLPIMGQIYVKEGEKLCLVVSSQEHSVTVTGSSVQTAQNQSASKEQLHKQLMKTGNTPFFFEKLEINLDGQCFVSVGELNRLRRDAIEELQQCILQKHRRKITASNDNLFEYEPMSSPVKEQPELFVYAETIEQVSVLLSIPEIRGFYISVHAFDKKSDTDWESDIISAITHISRQCHEKKKQFFLALPNIFRRKTAERYLKIFHSILEQLDGLVLKNIEEYAFLKQFKLSKEFKLVTDYSLYTMNHEAQRFWKEQHISKVVLPLELNKAELRHLALTHVIPQEIIVYGYIPMMISAQCSFQNTQSCHKSNRNGYITDRMGKQFLVKSHCMDCYNCIYNSEPLSLLGMEKEVLAIQPDSIRLNFTFESESQTSAVTNAFIRQFYYDEECPLPFSSFTRGHFKRGVE